MIDLNRPAEEIAAEIKAAAIANDDEILLSVAEHARAGFRSWAASKKSRRGDALNRVLTKSIVLLLDRTNTAPKSDEVIRNLWEVDDINSPKIEDISGKYGFIIWRDDANELQKTPFRCVKSRINRILEKQGISR